MNALLLALCLPVLVAAKNVYKAGDRVPLFANALTSIRTQAPVASSYLALCSNVATMSNSPWNVGARLQGNWIEELPHKLHMKQDESCKQLCVANVEGLENVIRKNYHHNWILDDMDTASKMMITNDRQGFPVGYIGDYGGAYIHNHVNIEIMYHPIGDDEYTVVRVTIKPFSTQHDFAMYNESSYEGVTILNPMPSCNPSTSASSMENVHTNYHMITATARSPQIASGQVLFTYDVRWISNEDVTWNQRWDIYVTMDHAIPDMIRYGSSIGCVTIVIMFLLFVYLCRLRNAAKLAPVGSNEGEDIDMELSQEKEPENQKATSCCLNNTKQKWRLLHGDVFRPPNYSLALVVACGTGAHLLSTSFVVLCAGVAKAWHPSHHGDILLGSILSYAFLGVVGGYVSAQFSQALGVPADRHRLATIITAAGFPVLLFGYCLGVVVWARCIESTLGVSVTTCLTLFFLWLLILLPLTLIGAHIGQRRIISDYPVETNEEPRLIPEKSCWMGYFCPLFSFKTNGVAPFATVYVELYFCMASVWLGYYPPPFSFLIMVFGLVVVTVSLMNITTTYWQLSRENHKWWWCSFRNGAAMGVFVLFYSFIWALKYYMEGMFAFYLYFGGMFLISLGTSLMLGFVGLSSSLWFNRTIYAMIVHTE